jgi:DNA-directed RNA polymerase subunit RPC12/RpoP
MTQVFYGIGQFEEWKNEVLKILQIECEKCRSIALKEWWKKTPCECEWKEYMYEDAKRELRMREMEMLERMREMEEMLERGYLYFDTLAIHYYKERQPEVVQIKCDECGSEIFNLKKLSPKHKTVAVCAKCSKIFKSN